MSTRGYREVMADSFIADEAIVQYAAVIYGSTGHVTNPTTAKEQPVGIAQEAADASGDVIRVLQMGKSYVIASASANIGDDIAIYDTVGRVSVPSGYSSGDFALGYYEEAPTASGDIVTAVLNIRELIR